MQAQHYIQSHFIHDIVLRVWVYNIITDEKSEPGVMCSLSRNSTQILDHFAHFITLFDI